MNYRDFGMCLLAICPLWGLAPMYPVMPTNSKVKIAKFFNFAPE